jgi:ornithine carbamoyltransferase
MVKNINDVTDLTGEEFDQLIERAIAFKGNPRPQPGALDGKIVRLLFDSPSLRTKTSFETAVRLLGSRSIL